MTGAFPLLAQELPDAATLARAERRLTRLSPDAFPELPAAVRQDLLRRGCRVPQPAAWPRPVNVIAGAFARPGQTDWAVLCSVKGVSTILVYWNGAAVKPAAIAARPDIHYVEMLPGNRAGFAREINAVGKEAILRHYDAYGGPKPPPVTHQGIDDAFLEKASITWYFHAGKWLQLTGAD